MTTTAPPFVVVETGSLLTLLLGGEPHQEGYAYAKLLVDAAKSGLIRLATTDMVMAEFTGCMAPLYAKDFQAEKLPFSVPKEYAYGEERIAMIRELLEAKALEIIRTPCADEYLERIKQGASFKQDIETLRKELMHSKRTLAQDVKNDRLPKSVHKQHRGEVSIADAIKILQQREGEGIDSPIFALFEGQHDRGIIVQRLSAEKNSEEYDIFDGRPAKQYDPNTESFDRKHAATLGEVTLLSTKGFLAGFQYAARALSPTHGRKKWFIISENEGKNKDSFDAAYQTIVENVNRNGLPRHYHRYRDRLLPDMMKNGENEFSTIDGEKKRAPWREYIETLVQEKSEPLRETVKAFIDYKQEAIKTSAQGLWKEIVAKFAQMQPNTLQSFLNWMVEELGKAVKDLPGHKK